jgi:signal transduction histidine kinase
MKKTMCICAFVVIFAVNLIAQKIELTDSERRQKADSLENILKTRQLTSLEKFVVLDSISEYLHNDLTGFNARGEEMLEIMKQENIDDKQKTVVLISRMGMNCVMMGEYEKAIDYLNKSLLLAREINDNYYETRIIINIGNAYSLQGQYVTALDYYLQTLKLCENYNDRDPIFKLNYGRAVGNIAETYYMMGNLSQALFYAEQFFVINPREIIPKNHVYAQVYYILASVYLDRDELDKAEENALCSFQCTNIIYQCFSTEALAKIYIRSGDYDKAMEYATESLRYADEFGDPSMYAKAYSVLSDVYIAQKQYAKAEITALKALETNPITLSIEPNLAYNIALANIHLGNKEKAESFLYKYNEIISRNNNKYFQEILASMEVQYETKKKELQIEVLEKNKTLRLWVNVLIGGSAVILLLLGYILFFKAAQNGKIAERDRKLSEQALMLAEQAIKLEEQKRKLAEQKMNQSEKDKELAVIKAMIIAEADERENLARHLHDVIGSMLITVRFNLKLIKSYYLMEQSDIDNLNTAVMALNQSITAVRHLAHYMMPPELKQYGLKVALENYCKDIPIAHFNYFGDDLRLDIELEILLYRFAFEVIANSEKYSFATMINVQLTIDNNLISLTVYDNGIGFDPNSVTFGMGFKNILHRIENYNNNKNKNKVNISSTINKETEISVEIEMIDVTSTDDTPID